MNRKWTDVNLIIGDRGNVEEVFTIVKVGRIHVEEMAYRRNKGKYTREAGHRRFGETRQIRIRYNHMPVEIQKIFRVRKPTTERILKILPRNTGIVIAGP